MTEPEEPPYDPLLEALILSARDRDSVRACHLMVAVYEQDGTVQFGKPVMLALWRDQYPSDNGTGQSSIVNRWSRAIASLGHTIAVSRDNQTMIIQDTPMCAWLANRNGLIPSIPQGSTVIPMSNEATAQITRLLAARLAAGQQTVNGVGVLAAEGTVDRAALVDTESTWVLSVEGEVVRDGQVVD